MPDQHYTVREVAALLRLSQVQVRRLIAAGAIRAIRFGRARRIPAEALERYLLECQVPKEVVP